MKIPETFTYRHLAAVVWNNPRMALYLAHHAWRWHKTQLAELAVCTALEAALACYLVRRLRRTR